MINMFLKKKNEKKNYKKVVEEVHLDPKNVDIKLANILTLCSYVVIIFVFMAALDLLYR